MRQGMKTLMTIAIVMLSGGLLVVGAAGPKRTTMSVTTTLADTQNTYPLRVQSDREGAYTNTATVASVMVTDSAGSDWQLTTYYLSRGRYAPSNRDVLFDLSEEASSGLFPAPISAPTYMPAHLIIQCSNVSVNMLNMTAGQSALCPGTFRFWAPNGQWYRLAMNPANYSEVDPLKVTCGSTDPSGCKVWTISPSGTYTSVGDPNSKNYTRLLMIDENGNVIDDGGGHYYVSFSITIAR